MNFRESIPQASNWAWASLLTKKYVSYTVFNLIMLETLTSIHFLCCLRVDITDNLIIDYMYGKYTSPLFFRFSKSVYFLMKKILWEVFVSWKAQLNRTTVLRNIICLKNVIPKTKANAKINSI